jgi:hypothetical protein
VQGAQAFEVTGDGWGRRGRLGEADGDLTGARVVVERWHDGNGGGRQKKCVTWVLERGRDLESEGRRCGGGWRSSGGLYRGPGEHWGEVTASS